jgi:hypothetical protein
VHNGYLCQKQHGVIWQQFFCRAGPLLANAIFISEVLYPKGERGRSGATLGRSAALSVAALVMPELVSA